MFDFLGNIFSVGVVMMHPPACKTCSFTALTDTNGSIGVFVCVHLCLLALQRLILIDFEEQSISHFSSHC